MSDTQQSPAAACGSFTLGGNRPIHRLGFGAMRLTGQGIWGPPNDKNESLAVLRRAVELGVNFIDTADAYGPNVSEELIAEALYPYPKGLVIATKGGLERPGPGVWTPNGRPQHLREALEGSLRRLKLARIDLYQFHRIDPAVPLEESVGELARLREEGKIQHIGLSNVNAEELNRARKIVPIVTVQNRYNATDRASEQLIDYCERNGIGFIPWAPLGGDTLSSTETLRQITKKYDATSSQIVLAWLLRRSGAMLPIPGTSSLKHLEENVASATIRLSLEDYKALRDTRR
ncbi:aldo/keto reductase [Dictyobacter arantiisoli]|uniref:Oxidoreductase n=1 Tax=Dictyobacter arantiisoli TaxID=2014874 RepID=A0A5A5T7Z2_9CHLR|nr:aldo/keto reductase [Dictyobacter arantiisoli]GCF07580.1 oxidoreductase [Dictyobacter arantiisoli]